MIDERRLFNVWTWLPAFHAVAAAPHLPTASRRLGLSVSAVSRSLTQLESVLGRRLFERVRGRLELNDDGRALQRALARAVGDIGGELARMQQPAAPMLRIAVSHALSQRLLARALLSALPDVVRWLHGGSDAEALRLVRSGDADVAFVATAPDAPDVERLGELTRGVYCGAGHEGEIGAHPFVGTADDVAAGRNVAVVVTQEDNALDLCVSGRLLAVLPDAVADPLVTRGQLRRLADAEPRAVLAAVGARAGGAVRAIVEAVCTQLRAPPPAPTRFQLGDELLRRAEWDAAAKAWATAARGSALDATDRAALHVRRLHLALLRGDWTALTRLAAQAPAKQSPVHRAWRESLIALGDCLRGRRAAAIRRLATAEALVAHLPPGERAPASMMVCRVAGNLALADGRADDACAAYAAGLTACDRVGDRWHRSIALYNLGDAELQRGDLDRAAALFDEASREKRELGDRWGRTYVQHGRALVALFRGEARQALREAAEGLALAVDLGDGRFRALLHLATGRAQLALADAAEAERAFQFAARAADRAHALPESVQAQLGLVESALRAGRAPAASRAAVRAMQLARKLSSATAESAALVARAAVARYAGDVALADRLAADAVRRAPLPPRSPWHLLR